MTESNKGPTQEGDKKDAKPGSSGTTSQKSSKKKTDAKASKVNKQKTSKRTKNTMTTSADASQTKSKEVAPSTIEAPVASAVQQPAAANTSSGKGVGILALLVSLIALGGAGYAWYQTAVNARLSGGEQSNRIANIEQRVDDFGTQQSGVSGLIEQIQQRVSGSETGVADQVSQVKQLVGSTETALASQISEVKQQIAKSETVVGEQISAVKQQIAKTESAVGEQMQTFRSENVAQQELVANQVATADAGLKEQSQAFRSEFDQLTGSIDALRNELGTSIDGWTLREIEHLLVMANQRLQLGSAASDAKTALSALQIADQRLKALDDPGLLATRQALSSEIAALAAVEVVDVASVSSGLGLLSSTLKDLPMKGTDKPAGPTREKGTAAASEGAITTEKITNAGKSFFSDLANLVQVEKGGEPILRSIAPEVQSLQVAQGQLILESAQIALVRQQADIFSERLSAAETWVGDYIVQDNPQTARWLEQLAEAKNAPISVSYPDISGSLAALRNAIGTEG